MAIKPQYLGSDRYLHDAVSTVIAGKKNARKDAAIDRGALKYGCQHRVKYPHRNIIEATGFLCIEDIKAGRRPDIKVNAAISAGHMLVDKLPSKLKTKFQLLNLISEVFNIDRP